MFVVKLQAAIESHIWQGLMPQRKAGLLWDTGRCWRAVYWRELRSAVPWTSAPKSKDRKSRQLPP